jgi:prevent-host-death family protein
MSMSVSDARANLPRVIDRVQAGDEIVITRHGVPVAVVVHPDRLHSRRVVDARRAALDLRDRLDQARRAPLSSADLTEEYAHQLVDQIRAAREAR